MERVQATVENILDFINERHEHFSQLVLAQETPMPNRQAGGPEVIFALAARAEEREQLAQLRRRDLFRTIKLTYWLVYTSIRLNEIGGKECTYNVPVNERCHMPDTMPICNNCGNVVPGKQLGFCLGVSNLQLVVK